MACRSTPPTEFTAASEDCGRKRTIKLGGEVDIASAPELQNVLTAALWGAEFTTVVIDLTDVTFIDSTGLSVLVDAHASSVQDGIRLVLRPGPPSVQRAFEVSGLTRLLPFVASASAY